MTAVLMGLLLLAPTLIVVSLILFDEDADRHERKWRRI